MNFIGGLIGVLRRLERSLFVRWPTLVAISIYRRFRRAQRSEDSLNILVLRLDGIGDCVMTLPLLSALRQRFPRAQVTVVVRPVAAPLFEFVDSVDEIIALPAISKVRWARVPVRDLLAAVGCYLRRLRGRHFDFAINPRWDFDFSMGTFLCALSRAPMTVGYEDATSPTKLDENIGFERAYNLLLPAGPYQHEVLRNLEIARRLGCVSMDAEPRLKLSEEAIEKGRRWLAAEPGKVRIALGLPAGDARRRWDAAHYVAFLELLLRRGEIQPLILADAETLATAQSIQKRFTGVTIVIGKSLQEIAAILANCDVFIGSDSGLAHMAAAIGCRAIVLSPHPKEANRNHANSPDRFAPHTSRASVLQPATAKLGCENGCVASTAHCILNINPADAAENVLAAIPPSSRWQSGSPFKERDGGG